MWEQIQSNRRKSALMVAFMAVLLVALGYFLLEYFQPGAGPAGVAIALVVWLIMWAVSWGSGDRIFLAMAKARRIEKKDLPQLWNVVEEMSIASGLGKMPEVYVIDDPSPNAFAVGRDPDRAAIAVTAGLLRITSRDELQGVIAHEIGHIRNRDVLLMLFAGIMVGAIALLAEVGLRAHWFGGGRSRRSSGGDGQIGAIIMLVAILLMILAPIIAQLVYFAISRRREYLADATAARYTRYPEGLASALEKIAAAPEKLAAANRVTAPMYIVNPLKREGRAASDLSSTHPPISERVRILRAMGGATYADYDAAYRQASGKKGVIPPSALAEKDTAGGPVAGAEPSARERARQVDDFFYRQGGYRVLDCACGATLKIPPGFLAPRVKCPHCGKSHDVGLFETLGAPRGS
jgi:heat shock protein HtpX